MAGAAYVVLASASPRRLSLFAQVGVPVVVVPADIDETRAPGEDPQVYAERMASEKARAALHRLEHEVAELRDGWVVAADTVVIVDGDTLSKPLDEDEARAQIRRLSGRAHDVVTAVAIARVGGPFDVFFERTTVHFRTLASAEIDAYVATGEGRDKCGAYGIQGMGAGLVTRVEGCYFNVVGLPISRTLARMVELGALTCWP